jgi:hypothetical protein
MCAGLCPDVLLRSDDDQAAAPAVDTGEVARSVWQSPYGPIVIEVVGDRVFVNGDWVEPHRP